MTAAIREADLYILRGNRNPIVQDTPEQRALVRTERWESIGGALRHLPNDIRVKVHPIALRKTCQSGTRQCCYLQTGIGGRNHGSKCEWYGDDKRAPYERHPECIDDARNGLIDELETDTSS